jgi:asparagine synthase (glutamine-hydrolysing)
MGGDGLDPQRLSRLDRAFDRAVERCLDPTSGGTVLYSGGIDSSLVAQAAARVGPVRLLTVGVEGSPDLPAAAEGAGLLGLPWTAKVVGPTEVDGALAAHDLRDRPEPARSVLTSLALGIGFSPTDRVLVGQGADELFGGYAHFRGLDRKGAGLRRDADWRTLVEVDWPATVAIAGRLGKDVQAPFLDAEFHREAGAIPLEPVEASELTKPALRVWAVHRGLPEGLVRRPKKAIQYGSGIARLVGRSAPG